MTEVAFLANLIYFMVSLLFVNIMLEVLNRWHR